MQNTPSFFEELSTINTEEPEIDSSNSDPFESYRVEAEKPHFRGSWEAKTAEKKSRAETADDKKNLSRLLMEGRFRDLYTIVRTVKNNLLASSGILEKLEVRTLEKTAKQFFKAGMVKEGINFCAQNNIQPSERDLVTAGDVCTNAFFRKLLGKKLAARILNKQEALLKEHEANRKTPVTSFPIFSTFDFWLQGAILAYGYTHNTKKLLKLAKRLRSKGLSHESETINKIVENHLTTPKSVPDVSQL